MRLWLNPRGSAKERDEEEREGESKEEKREKQESEEAAAENAMERGLTADQRMLWGWETYASLLQR